MQAKLFKSTICVRLLHQYLVHQLPGWQLVAVANAAACAPPTPQSRYLIGAPGQISKNNTRLHVKVLFHLAKGNKSHQVNVPLIRILTGCLLSLSLTSLPL